MTPPDPPLSRIDPRRGKKMAEAIRRGITRVRAVAPNRARWQALLDPPDTASAISAVSQEAGVGDNEAAELLGASLELSAKKLTETSLASHWADVLALVSLVLLLALPKLGRMATGRDDADADAKAAALGRVPHIVAARDLSPYVPLRSLDLDPKGVSSPEAAARLVAEFVGRYPFNVIKMKQAIELAMVSTHRIDLDHHAVLHVILAAKPATESNVYPRDAVLLLSSKALSSPLGQIFPIKLLNLDGDGVGATIAVPDSRLPEMAQWLGSSAAFLSAARP